MVTVDACACEALRRGDWMRFKQLRMHVGRGVRLHADVRHLLAWSFISLRRARPHLCSCQLPALMLLSALAAAVMDQQHLSVFLSPLASMLSRGVVAQVVRHLRDAQQRGDPHIAWALTQGFRDAASSVLPVAAQAVQQVSGEDLGGQQATQYAWHMRVHDVRSRHSVN